jgi:hypothetical protein
MRIIVIGRGALQEAGGQGEWLSDGIKKKTSMSGIMSKSRMAL